MAVVKQNTLKNFLNRIEKVENYNLDKDQIIKRVEEIAKDIAEEEYLGTNIIVGSEVSGSNVKITAQGKGIAYMEFGTGIEGEGSYDGELPTDKLVFNSRGSQQTTDGWEYNYYKKQNIKNNPNLPDWKGFKAQAQMFRTAQRLKNELAGDIVKEIKGE